MSDGPYDYESVEDRMRDMLLEELGTPHLILVPPESPRVFVGVFDVPPVHNTTGEGREDALLTTIQERLVLCGEIPTLGQSDKIAIMHECDLAVLQALVILDAIKHRARVTIHRYYGPCTMYQELFIRGRYRLSEKVFYECDMRDDKPRPRYTSTLLGPIA